jgi:hypothetical protein
LVTSLLIAATPVFEELHATETNVCVLLSVNVPVATNGCVEVTVKVGADGLTEIEANPGGVSVLG